MSQTARHCVRSPREFDNARETSRALWRELLISLGKASAEDSPADLAAAPPLPLGISGRYLAGDASEFECTAAEISVQGVRIDGPWRVAEGAWCAANLADVGIVEGVVVEAGQTSFRLGVVAAPFRLQRLVQRFGWRIRRDWREIEDRRKSQRIDMQQAEATLRTRDGREAPCRIFNLSDGGAALHLGEGALYFWVDQEVELEGRAGRVLRYFPGGLVIRFDAAVAEG
jgi:hypothetical protein